MTLKQFYAIIIYIGIVGLAIIIGLAGAEHYQQQRHDEILQNQTELRATLKHRNYLDSLYYEHLSRCSMIDEENIGIDRRGYLYSKYHKKYGW